MAKEKTTEKRVCIAVIDRRGKGVYYEEDYAPDDPQLAVRFNALSQQAELNAAGLNPEVEKHDGWGVYRGEKPFDFADLEAGEIKEEKADA